MAELKMMPVGRESGVRRNGLNGWNGRHLRGQNRSGKEGAFGVSATPSSQPTDRPGAPAGLQYLKELGQLQMPNTQSDVFALPIIGQIEGHMVMTSENKTTKYEHIIPQLVAVEQNPAIKGLLVVLNTVGGDIEAGLAIAEMLASLSKPKVSLVLGGGHSIGVPIAVAADYSFIAETATMTVHPIRLTGMVIGVPQTYDYMNKMSDRVIRFVTRHSPIDEGKFRELMFRTGELATDVGTILIGQEAVEVGLMDEVGGLSAAMRKALDLVNGVQH